MTVTEDPQDRISNALMGVIEPGTSWIVRGIANDVLVEPFDVSKTEGPGLSPTLATRIDAFNQRLSDTGGTASMFALLLVVLICIGLQLDWFADLLGPLNAKLQSIWFYLGFCISAFFVTGFITSRWEVSVYQRHRDALFDQIRQEGLKPEDVYVRIKDDEDLQNLVSRMKEDTKFLGDGLVHR